MDSNERHSCVTKEIRTQTPRERDSPATETVASDELSSSLANTCKESPDGLFLTQEKLILLVEEKNESEPPLDAVIERASGRRVTVATLREAASIVCALMSRIAIVLLTANRNYEETIRFINHLKEIAIDHRFDCPHIFVLSRIPLGPEAALRFEQLGAEYLLRQYPEPIIEAVKKVLWVVRRAKSLPTIRVYRSGGHIMKVVAEVGASQKELRLGPRLRELLEMFALNRHIDFTTHMIADRMGLCVVSPKKYMADLRNAWDRAFAGEPVVLTGHQVFVTGKIPGGYVHRVSAHFEILDQYDF